MTELELNDEDRSAMEDRQYSKVIGRKLLKRVKEELGDEVLVQFGVTKTILNRMIERGVMGWEIDILSAILVAKDMFKQKYLKRWEWELMKQVYPIFNQYFYMKPLMLLALHPESSHRYRWIKLDNVGYEDIFWGDKWLRPFLDRKFIYDAMIYLICRLNHWYGVLGKEQLDEVLFKDFGTVHQDQPTPSGIFYSYFTECSIDSNSKLIRTVVAKSPNAYDVIKRLYVLIRTAFSEQCIGNIEDYTVNASGPKVETHWGQHLVNFAFHLKHSYMDRLIPNIFLADLNAMCSKLCEKKV